MIELLVVNVFVSLIVGHWARSWGRDRYEWTAMSILLSPLVGAFLLLVIGRKFEGTPAS